jgi:hypothetical protein
MPTWVWVVVVSVVLLLMLAFIWSALALGGISDDQMDEYLRDHEDDDLDHP